MRCRNDTPDLDVESPIAYAVTEKGRFAVEFAEAQERVGFCEHEWQRYANEMVCCRCGLDRPLQNGPSIQGYAPRKGRHDW